MTRQLVVSRQRLGVHGRGALRFDARFGGLIVGEAQAVVDQDFLVRRGQVNDLLPLPALPRWLFEGRAGHRSSVGGHLASLRQRVVIEVVRLLRPRQLVPLQSADSLHRRRIGGAFGCRLPGQIRHQRLGRLELVVLGGRFDLGSGILGQDRLGVGRFPRIRSFELTPLLRFR